MIPKTFAKILKSRLFFLLFGFFMTMAVFSVEAGVLTTGKDSGEVLAPAVWLDLVADLNGFESRLAGLEGGSSVDPVISKGEYSLNCTSGDTCEHTQPLGVHKYCALAGISGPGGKDTSCQISGSVGGSYTLSMHDHKYPSNSQGCGWICFD